MKLEPAPSLRNLLEIAVDAEDSTKNSSLTKPQIIEVFFSSGPGYQLISTFFQENCSDTHSTARNARRVFFSEHIRVWARVESSSPTSRLYSQSRLFTHVFDEIGTPGTAYKFLRFAVHLLNTTFTITG